MACFSSSFCFRSSAFCFAFSCFSSSFCFRSSAFCFAFSCFSSSFCFRSSAFSFSFSVFSNCFLYASESSLLTDRLSSAKESFIENRPKPPIKIEAKIPNKTKFLFILKARLNYS
ncbi:hypothetical protein C5F47_07720 [Nitrosopumilus cobalaminigenes]|uniref:Uncharacterized protein n=1 Tax=Nitrosopumilus cobalaminigenes TaxID=1470066 RepID=A0A7D5R8R6_9ARCH|nr:hypothetical protein C5F47_07720 [Nitrosopumilus cobalaminigenes]